MGEGVVNKDSQKKAGIRVKVLERVLKNKRWLRVIWNWDE